MPAQRVVVPPSPPRPMGRAGPPGSRPTCRRAVAALVAFVALGGLGPRAARATTVADCLPPTSGDWIIAASCELRQSYGAPGDVVVAAGATLRVMDGAVLGLDFDVAALRVASGGQLQIDAGSRVDALRLELAGLEATQAVQDLEGTLRLIEDKPAYVRAYVQSVGDPVPNVVLRLRAFRAGAELAGSPLASSPPSLALVSPDALARRATYAASANFRLPAAWRSGDVTLRVEAPGTALRCAEAAGTDGDCAVTASFQTRRRPRVWVVPFDIGTAGAPNLPLNADIVAEQDLLVAMFPLPGVTFVRRPIRTVAPVNGQEVLDDLNGLYDATLLAWIFGYLGGGFTSPFAMPDQMYGAIAGAVPRSATNANTPSGVSNPTWTNPPGAGRVAYGMANFENTLAHEIDHNLDIAPAIPGLTPSPGTWGRHVGNPISNPADPLWGCGATGPDPLWPRQVDEIGDSAAASALMALDLTDPGSPVVHPATRPDFMSYCNDSTTPGTWISDYRWQRLEFPANDTAGFPGTLAGEASAGRYAVNQAPEIRDRIHVQVEVGRQGGGRILDASVLPSLAPSEVRAPDGPFGIRLLRADGTEILRHPFAVSFEDPEGNVLDQVRARFQLPADGAVAAIELVLDGEVLDRLVVSPSAPTVTVLEPNGGETWTAGGTVRWAASDPDGDPLHFDVFYAPDGIAWEAVALDLAGDALVVPAGTVPGGSAAKIRIVASDGFHTAQDDSDGPFVVSGNAPTIAILAPDDDSEFGFWDAIGLRAYANDVEDGPLVGEAVVWSVEGRPGRIATGDRATIMAADLGPGVRRLRATATDRGGAESFAVITVSVRAPAGRIFAPIGATGRDALQEAPGARR